MSFSEFNKNNYYLLNTYVLSMYQFYIILFNPQQIYEVGEVV